MAKIRIKTGGCGIKYTDAHGVVRHALKTPEDGPCECHDDVAARLVGLSVAEYVYTVDDTPPTEQPAESHAEQTEEPADEVIDDDSNTGHLDAAQLESMTIKQLESLAGDLGVDVSGCKKKADYIAAIIAVDIEVDDDDDELPELTAADPE